MKGFTYTETLDAQSEEREEEEDLRVEIPRPSIDTGRSVWTEGQDS